MNNQPTFERGLKLKDFYFTRHGMTDANHEKLLCGGDWDIPLNAEGHRQAAQAASEHGNALASIQTICCSPLLRARQTAEYFAKELRVPMITIPELGEQKLGEWERKPWQNVPEYFTGDKDPPQGESRSDLDVRIQRALELALKEDGPVLLVSHGAVWYALQRVLGLSPEQPGSCSIFHFQEESQVYQRRKL